MYMRVCVCVCVRACVRAQPPFTVQLQDQYNNVVEQKINASAGEFRFDSARVIHSEQGVDPVSAYPRRKWAILRVQDSNGLASSSLHPCLFGSLFPPSCTCAFSHLPPSSLNLCLFVRVAAPGIGSRV